MNSRLKEQAIKLRLEKEYSYGEIRKALGVPKSTLCDWLRDFPLRAEKILELNRNKLKKNEAKIEKYRNTMRDKRSDKDKQIYRKYQEKFRRLSGDAFFASGLMLYLAEGSKKNLYSICLTNTDPKVIKFFIKWLNNFFDIGKDSIKIGLHLYENMNIDKEKIFWEKELSINKNQFYKPWISKLKASSFTYKESYGHGTCSIYVSGVDKKRELMMAIKAFVDKFI